MFCSKQLFLDGLKLRAKITGPWPVSGELVSLMACVGTADVSIFEGAQ